MEADEKSDNDNTHEDDHSGDYDYVDGVDERRRTRGQGGGGGQEGGVFRVVLYNDAV